MPFFRDYFSHVETDDAYVTGEASAVGSRISEVVTKVFVKDNDFVEKGTLLVRSTETSFRYKPRRSGLSSTSKCSSFRNWLKRSTPSERRLTRREMWSPWESPDFTNRSRRSKASKTWSGTGSQSFAGPRPRCVPRRSTWFWRRKTSIGSITCWPGSPRRNRSSINGDPSSSPIVKRSMRPSSKCSRPEPNWGYRPGTRSLTRLLRRSRKPIPKFGDRWLPVNKFWRNRRSLCRTWTRTHSGRPISAFLARPAGWVDQVPSVRVAQGELDETLAALGGRSFDPARLDEQPSVRKLQKELEEAELKLSFTEIRAPVSGFVNRKSVNPGDHVQVGQALMAIQPLDSVYIVANFKETQLSNIVIGQPVEICVDAYPGAPFKGRVSGFAAATASHRRSCPLRTPRATS